MRKEAEKKNSNMQEMERVIRQYSDMVYRLAFARVGSKHDADEIYQEVFYRYVRKRPVFVSEDHAKNWFLRVTLNCANSFFTSPWRRRTESLSEEIPYLDEERLELWQELSKLPEKYRQVLHLFYYEEMSVAEISGLLRRRESTVRTQLTRARKLLREILEEEGFHADENF